MPKEKQDRDALTSRAMGIASAEERAAYIAQACGNDAELKRQVEERVAAHFQEDSQEEPAPPVQTSTPAREGSPVQAEARHVEGGDFPITRIGPYKILKQVGEDGVGIAFQGEQQEPVQLLVALKVVKESLDWQQIVARFENERQRLSQLDHPHIAKILGGGTRQSGQPYFVEEWVDGMAITKYCDEHQLSLKQRLELFVPVCQAVQYAHQKGVIHGDLKPTNVLVAGQDDKPTPKILDFGVAKAVRRKPTDSSPPSGDSGGHPESMSPEQADANVRDIDTRSDVYNLGALLYELLTGTTPLSANRLKDVSVTEALRLIREEEIPPPSTRLSESKDRGELAATKRQMKPAALVKAVRGELDCLVMKALQKDRTQRYATAHDLARDVQRHLAHEPLEACPPSAGKHLWMAARKHPRVLAAVVVVLLLSLLTAAASVGVALWEWREAGRARKAEQEADKKSKKAAEEETETKGKLRLSEAARKAVAKERDQARTAEKSARRTEEETKTVLTFLKDKLLSAGRPAGMSLVEAFWAAGQNKDVSLHKAVDLVEPQVADAFPDQPLGEATIREMLGWAYLNVGDATQAVKQYERAFALREAMQGVNDADTADCRNKLAVAYRLAGRPTEAARLFERNPNSPAHASALAIRGSLLLSQKKPVEAELKLRECLAIRQKVQPDAWTTFDTKSVLGEALLEQNRCADAEPLLLSGYEGMKQREANIPAQDKVRLTRSLERLVRLYEVWGKTDKAAKWRKELETVKNPKTP